LASLFLEHSVVIYACHMTHERPVMIVYLRYHSDITIQIIIIIQHQQQNAHTFNPVKF